MFPLHIVLSLVALSSSVTETLRSEVTLVGGSTPSEGNVYVVNSEDKLAPICDYGWGVADATVVCRQLGYPDGTFTVKSKFGAVPEDLRTLAGVNCNGEEARIQDCPFDGEGYCYGGDGAGVICITDNVTGVPDPPILNMETGDGEIVDGNIIELPPTDHYEVSWRIPEDNGTPIDFYSLEYYPVRKEYTEENTIIWQQIGNLRDVGIPHDFNTRWSMQLDYPDTFYKMELMAHNQFGYSQETVLIIKTARAATSGDTNRPKSYWQTPQYVTVPQYVPRATNRPIQKE